MIWEQVGYAIIDNLKCGMPLVVGFCQTDWQAAAEAERLKGEVPASVYNDMQIVSAVLTFGDNIVLSYTLENLPGWNGSDRGAGDANP